MNSEMVSMCVVPAIVRHKPSDRKDKSYPMLNTCGKAKS